MTGSFKFLPLKQRYVISLNLNYGLLSVNLPAGWKLDMLDYALALGYSVFGLHMLQPKPEVWTVKKLQENRISQDPYVLEPFLATKVQMYVNGETDKIVGFKITDDIARHRQSRLQQRQAQEEDNAVTQPTLPTVPPVSTKSKVTQKQRPPVAERLTS